MALDTSDITRDATDRDVPGITRPMTYEEYMASPEEIARYDIIDGWKIYRLYGRTQLANPTRVHQEIALNLAMAFRAYQRRTVIGNVVIAPCDVLVTLQPLHTRQPDLLFISNERWTANPPPHDPTPLSPAPELVVEIVSPSDRANVLDAKIADYRAVNVQEIWIVRAETQSIEVMSLAEDNSQTYLPGQKATSVVFEGLTAAVDDIFIF